MVKYEPSKWNDNPNITQSHNCYSYFLNKISPVEEFRCKSLKDSQNQLIENGDINNKLHNASCNTPQPGYAKGLSERVYKQTRKKRTATGFRYKCSNVLPRIRKDNPDIKFLGNSREAFYQKCPENYFKGAVATTSPESWKHSDYHFYRQDDNGLWSHKDGKNPAKNVDAKGNVIVDPYLADRNYKRNKYTEFCSYFCVPNDTERLQMSSLNKVQSSRKGVQTRKKRKPKGKGVKSKSKSKSKLKSKTQRKK